ncbi:MAG: hypothetical protein FJ144_21115 [Deltaproteobacteria bacterium]|nr:hypothetical protein [Deltaproteobacteria bacterium]
MTRPNPGTLSLGMSKNDVIEPLGEPDQVLASPEAEVLGYEYDRTGDGPYGGAWAFVRSCDSKVGR